MGAKPEATTKETRSRLVLVVLVALGAICRPPPPFSLGRPFRRCAHAPKHKGS